ncbi:hypothetical protein AVEN_79194-1 [Araneus ventricosus]|uniref:Uncharacterized protein n=1 Tax=Araneus ventricosus TaxID=182803 RepID=A0A4Y2VH38_ARAVE|nr:hypothetical protein AVEN_162521-1 [Araneus ventricosus]GBO24600.1 hypothetical protein AVEN_79194-1 [Araneus ventricosus]
MSREFGIVPISQCLLPKSELIRDFKSELITQLFSALWRLKTKFETPKSVLHRAPVSTQHSIFIAYLKGWSSAFLSPHWTIVFLVDQQLNLQIPNGQLRPWGKFSSFPTSGAIQV